MVRRRRIPLPLHQCRTVSHVGLVDPPPPAPPVSEPNTVVIPPTQPITAQPDMTGQLVNADEFVRQLRPQSVGVNVEGSVSACTGGRPVAGTMPIPTAGFQPQPHGLQNINNHMLNGGVPITEPQGTSAAGITQQISDIQNQIAMLINSQNTLFARLVGQQQQQAQVPQMTGAVGGVSTTTGQTSQLGGVMQTSSGIVQSQPVIQQGWQNQNGGVLLQQTADQTVPGLKNTDNIPVSEIRSVCKVEGIQDKTLKAAVCGEYIPLQEFLSNYSINSDTVHDVQAYVDSEGYVQHKPKKAKRKIVDFTSWLEAFEQYERLMVNIHGIDLYNVMSEYKILILEYDRRYNWNNVHMLDMRHRSMLSKRSVQFTNIDFNLMTTIFDPTVVKQVPRCTRCRGFDHHISECPFPPAPTAKSVMPRQRASGGATEVCNNFNNLRCNFRSCRRKHV